MNTLLPRYAILFVIVVGVYLALSWHFDWLEMNHFGWQVFALRLFCSLSVGVLIVSFTAWLLDAEARTRKVFLGWCGCLSMLLAIFWPGFIMSDSYAAYMYVNSLPLDSWLGYGYLLWCSAILQVAPEFWAVALTQVLLLAWTIARMDAVLRPHLAARTLLFHFGLALSIPFLFNSILITRDQLFAICTTAALVETWRVCVKRRGSRHELLSLSFLYASMLIMRSDGIVIVGMFTVALWAFVGGSRYVVTSCFALALSAIALVLMPRITGVSKDEFGYRMSLTLNPLGYIIQHNYESPDRARLEREIDKVVDVDKVKDLSTADEIPVLWAGGLRRNSTEEERRNYYRIFYELVKDNPELLLEGRWQTFLGATGLAKRTLTFMPFDVQAAWEADPTSRDEDQPLVRLEPFWGRLRSGSIKLMSPLLDPPNRLVRAIVWTFLPHLLLLVFLATRYKLAPVTSLCSIALLSRVPLLFLLEPGSHFKYYLFLISGAVFLVCAWRAELSLAEKTKAGIASSLTDSPLRDATDLTVTLNHSR